MMKYVDFDQLGMHCRFGSNISIGDLVIRIRNHSPTNNGILSGTFDNGSNKSIETKCIRSIEDENLIFTDGDKLNIEGYINVSESYKFYRMVDGVLGLYKPETQIYQGFSKNFTCGDVFIISDTSCTTQLARLVKYNPRFLELEAIGDISDTNARKVAIKYNEFGTGGIRLKCILKSDILGNENELASWDMANDTYIVISEILQNLNIGGTSE